MLPLLHGLGVYGHLSIKACLGRLTAIEKDMNWLTLLHGLNNIEEAICYRQTKYPGRRLLSSRHAIGYSWSLGHTAISLLNFFDHIYTIILGLLCWWCRKYIMQNIEIQGANVGRKKVTQFT